ncbi:MAG: hypothetical protein N4A45_04370 [Flavobacteriales bacterium]|jgi:hypothetical protein|nr:hypothetical protein [Flavobacteriales bacterium]
MNKKILIIALCSFGALGFSSCTTTEVSETKTNTVSKAQESSVDKEVESTQSRSIPAKRTSVDANGNPLPTR